MTSNSKKPPAKPRCYPIHDPDGSKEKQLRSGGRYKDHIPLCRRGGEFIWVERLPAPANNPLSEPK